MPMHDAHAHAPLLLHESSSFWFTHAQNTSPILPAITQAYFTSRKTVGLSFGAAVGVSSPRLMHAHAPLLFHGSSSFWFTHAHDTSSEVLFEECVGIDAVVLSVCKQAVHVETPSSKASKMVSHQCHQSCM